MGKSSNIEWTDRTWNPWHGCRHVSEGCRFCYMFREKRKYGQEPTKVVRSKTTFYDPFKWQDPANVFTCSWSDWFIKEADEWRAEAWSIIKRTPHLTYQILTKRIERAANHLPDDWGVGYPNVWLGVSCEDQKMADERIPALVEIPAAVRFVSAEPLLGSLTLAPWLCSCPVRCEFNGGSAEGYLDLVIAGGESGTKDEAVRPSNPDWFRSLRDQCVVAGVPFFFKQWGEWFPREEWEHNPELVLPDDSDAYIEDRTTRVLRTDIGEPVPMHRVGRNRAGRLLDGREWNQMPAMARPAVV